LRLARAKIVKEELVENDKSFLAIYLETNNSRLLLMSECEDQLGTLAVAIPQPPKLVGPALSSVLLGDRNVMIARALAELLARNTKKIALVSVYTKSLGEKEAAPIFRKLMEKTLRKQEDEQ
jgi:hypothetical protein